MIEEQARSCLPWRYARKKARVVVKIKW